MALDISGGVCCDFCQELQLQLINTSYTRLTAGEPSVTFIQEKVSCSSHQISCTFDAPDVNKGKNMHCPTSAEVWILHSHVQYRILEREAFSLGNSSSCMQSSHRFKVTSESSTIYIYLVPTEEKDHSGSLHFVTAVCTGNRTVMNKSWLHCSKQA